MLYWNIVFRMLLEVSLELSIICLIDIALRNWSTWGYIMSYSFSILFTFSLLGVPLWIRFYLRKQNLKDPAYKVKMGAAYEGLKAKPSSLIVTEWFFYRRMIYAAAAFFGQGQLWLQF